MRHMFRLSVTLAAVDPVGDFAAADGDGASITKECSAIFADGVLPEGAATVAGALNELLCRMEAGSGVSVE